MAEPDKRDLERLAALRKLMDDDPRSLAFVSLAEEHIRLGQHAEAAAVAQRGLLTHPDSVAGRLALAVAEASQNHIREALEQIKRALIIDQENPRALALMGRILLERGLAKRAVQFLSHAVKLQPGEAEYAELLRRARRAAKSEKAEDKVPVFSGDSVPASASPWNEDDSADGTVTSESEHTVFDPDALKQLRSKARKGRPDELGSALGALPSLGHGLDADAEPTAYHQQSPRPPAEAPRRAAPGPAPREEPTAFAYPQAATRERSRRPKMGGSAAEFSQMMRQVQAEAPPPPRSPPPPPVDDLVSELPSPVAKLPSQRTPPPPPPLDPEARRERASQGAGPADSPITGSERARPVLPEAAAPEAEAPERRVRSRAQAAPEVPPHEPPAAAPEPPAAARPADGPPPEPERPRKAESRAKPEAPPPEPVAEPPKPADALAPEAKPAKAEPAKVKAAAKVEAAEAPAAKPAHKGIGPAATRMVDDALWALFGKKPPVAEAPPEVQVEVAPDEAPKKAPVRAKLRGQAPSAEEKGEAPARAPAGPRVVRTSARFGAWTRAAVMLVLSVTVGFVGYGLALSSAGPGPEIASEELKGIAGDLERGGLAALLAAEEQIGHLERRNPDLRRLLNGALAEVYARRYTAFGGDREMELRAREALRAFGSEAPTVEVLVARAALSTSSADRRAVLEELDATLAVYPDSPKTWLAKSKIAAEEGRGAQALEALYRAHGINPQHRSTLLELARWHGSRRAWGSAFAYFDQLQERYPMDVEAAIERYVLGLATGADPSESTAVSTLAGLVRDENPQVAKDETGRAALAFAIPRLARGQLQQGIDQLGKAEAAFDTSAAFKAALAGAFAALGEWSRAKKHYARALELEPDNDAHRLGLARASFGERAGLRRDKDTPEAKGQPEKAGIDTVALPFGTLKVVPGSFALITVEPDPRAFPGDAFAELAQKHRGEALSKPLEAAALVALAHRRTDAKQTDEAIALLEQSIQLHDLPAAHLELGRAYVARKDYAGAVRVLKKGLEQAPGDVPGRLALARALTQQGKNIEAIEVLETFEDGEAIAPDAMLLLARLRIGRGDLEGALESLKAATRIRPKAAAGWLMLGEALHRLGRSGDALDAFRKALAAEPKLATGAAGAVAPVASMYLGRIELEKNERRGLALLRQSLEGEDAPVEAHFWVGKALLGSKKTKKDGLRELEIFLRQGGSGELRQEAERLSKSK